MTYQRNRGITLLNNYNDSLKNYELALNSAGTADQKFAIYQESTQASIDKAKASLEGFAQGLFDSKGIKATITAFTELIDVLNTLINNPVSTGIIQIGLFTASIYALGLAYNATKKSAIAYELSFYALMLAEEGLIVTTRALTATIMASPLFIPALIATGIYAFVKLFDAATVSASELKEEMNGLTSSIQSLQSEKDKLLAKDNLTEQEKKHLAILEAQIKAQKTLLADKAKLSTSKEYMEEDYYSFDEENPGKTNSNVNTIKENIANLKQYNQELKNLDPTTENAYQQEQKLNTQIAEATKYLGEKYESIQKNIKILEDSNEQNSEEYKLLTSLSTAIEDVIGKTNDEADAIFDAYSKTKLADADFYNALKANHTSLFQNLSALYGNDVNNWTNLAQAKEAIELGLISTLGNAWAKYFEAFQAGSLLTSPSSVGDFKNIENGSLAVDQQTYAQLKALDQLAKASAETAKKFKDLNTTPNIGGSSKESSQAAEKELYTSKEYENSIEQLNRQLDILKNNKDKLNSSSQEYRDNLQQENTLLNQQQNLAHQYAEELRQQQSSLLVEINSMSGVDWFNSSDDTRSSIFDSMYESKKNERQKYFNDLLKDFDDVSKGITDAQESWQDWQREIESNNLAIVTSKLEDFSNQIDKVNDKISNAKSIMDIYSIGTKEYTSALETLKSSYKELNTIYQNQANYLRTQMALVAANSAAYLDYANKLYEVEQAQIALKLSLQSQLSSLADEVISMYKEVYQELEDAETDTIQKLIDAEEERHDTVSNNLDDELDQYKKIIDAQKRAIQDEQDSDTYESDLADLQTERQELLNKISLYSNDNSIEGRKKLSELNKDLADKDEEIEKLKNDRTVDLRLAALDDLEESYEKEVKAKQDAENNEYESRKAELENEMELVENHYNELINNERYFSKIREEILAGNLSTVESDFANFASLISASSTTIGENLSEGIIYKMSSLKEELKNVVEQVSLLGSEAKNVLNNISYDTPSGSSGDDTDDEDNGSSDNGSTTQKITKGMYLTDALDLAGIEWYYDSNKNLVYLNGSPFMPDYIQGTMYDANEQRNKVNDLDKLKDLFKRLGGNLSAFHTGGIVGGSGSSLTELVNSMLNTNANETTIKALLGEVYSPPQNLSSYFVSNMQKLTSAIPTSSTVTSGDTNYHLTLNIANMTGDKSGAQTVYKELVKGLAKMGK